MSRKRMLDPMIWDDPDLILLSPYERLLFIGLVSLADDYGHMAAHPALLRKKLFGYDDLSLEEITSMRDRLVAQCRNVQIYTVDGQDYVWLKRWEEHQDLRFRSKGQYPCHACGERHKQNDYEESGCSEQPIASEFLRISTQDIRNICGADYVTSCNVRSNQDTECNVTRAKTTKPTKPSKPNYDEDFERFWQEYPRKVGKAKARESYVRAIEAGTTPEMLMTAIHNYNAECRMTGREMQFICHATTFLNQSRHNDYQRVPDPTDFQPRASPTGYTMKQERSNAAVDEAVAKFKKGESYFDD